MTKSISNSKDEEDAHKLADQFKQASELQTMLNSFVVPFAIKEEVFSSISQSIPNMDSQDEELNKSKDTFYSKNPRKVQSRDVIV